VDVVIDPSAEALARLVDALASSGFYVDAATARDAMKRRRQFNAIHAQSAVKIDLIVRKDRPFSREELGRRQRAVLPGGTRWRLPRTRSCRSWSGPGRAGAPRGSSPMSPASWTSMVEPWTGRTSIGGRGSWTFSTCGIGWQDRPAPPMDER
jgi:hypothetical protein